MSQTPSKLVNEIIEALSTDASKTCEALLKTKVLLHKLGHSELNDWVSHELGGYPSKSAVPSYRVLSTTVLANITNGYHIYNAHPIPLGHLDARYRKELQTSKMHQSISVLEEFLKNDDGHLEAQIPPEANQLLGKPLSNGYWIQRAWCQISKPDISQITTQIRSRLLDFVLELSAHIEKSKTDGLNEEELKLMDTPKMFNHAIFGSNTTIIVGNNNKQSLSIDVTADNFRTLADLLMKNGVDAEDVSELKCAIDEDSKNIDIENRQFGPATKEWLKKMLGKAVDTSWQVEVGVASSLLASALQKYYGWL